jgi:hypothetical protein
MDTFENASPPQEQPEMVPAVCRECGQTRMCHEHAVRCTGTRSHTWPDCREAIPRRAS